jgi:DegV family protein with EDD domain
MSVFFFDTDCELWHTEADKLGVQIIEMPYTIGNVSRGYDLGKNTDFKEYFNQMKKGEVPTTQALNPFDYVTYFEPFFKKGEDIIYVHFSHNLSGTFAHMQSAVDELKAKYPERKFTEVDTLGICAQGGSLVKEAAQLHNSGVGDSDVKKFVEENRQNFAEYFIVDDLKYLKRGGRVSSVTAVVGTMLNVKPILKVDSEGRIVSVGKAIGRKKAVNELFNYFVKLQENAKEHDIIVLHADCEEDAQDLCNRIMEVLPNAKPKIQWVGPVIGCHCGPGTLGISFHSKNR